MRRRKGLSGQKTCATNCRHLDISESPTIASTLYRTLLELSKPIIAATHGYALGGGSNMAMSSDIVIAADNAVFGYPELKVGLVATAVIPPLVHQVSRKAAFELLTLCENINAERALALGMINRVGPADRLMDEASGRPSRRL